MSPARRLLASLLWLACGGAAVGGCGDRKLEQIERGIENVDRHAGQIENEADRDNAEK